MLAYSRNWLQLPTNQSTSAWNLRSWSSLFHSNMLILYCKIICHLIVQMHYVSICHGWIYCLLEMAVLIWRILWKDKENLRMLLQWTCCNAKRRILQDLEWFTGSIWTYMGREISSFYQNWRGTKKKNKQFSCPFAGWNWKKAKSLSTRSHARWRGEAAAWWGPRAASRAASRRRMGLRLLPDEERRDPVPTAAAAPRLVDRTLS